MIRLPTYLCVLTFLAIAGHRAVAEQPPKSFDQFAIESEWDGWKMVELVANKSPAVARRAAQQCLSMSRYAELPTQLHRKRWRAMGESLAVAGRALEKGQKDKYVDIVLLVKATWELPLDTLASSSSGAKELDRVLNEQIKEARLGFRDAGKPRTPMPKPSPTPDPSWPE